jgi:hypothetical protein
MSVKECSELLKTLTHPERVECYTDGKKIMLMLNLDGLKSDLAFKILHDVRRKVRKHAGKPVRVYATGVFELA